VARNTGGHRDNGWMMTMRWWGDANAAIDGQRDECWSRNMSWHFCGVPRFRLWLEIYVPRFQARFKKPEWSLCLKPKSFGICETHLHFQFDGLYLARIEREIPLSQGDIPLSKQLIPQWCKVAIDWVTIFEESFPQKGSNRLFKNCDSLLLWVASFKRVWCFRPGREYSYGRGWSLEVNLCWCTLCWSTMHQF
jgi:hypothetical protein